MMDDLFEQEDMFSLSEIDHLRVEALQLYDKCLAEGSATHMFRFIERQLSASVPPMTLLRSMADDLQQRLFALREDHFNVREKVVNTFRDVYHVDVSPLIPPDQLEVYHRIKPQAVLDYVGQHGLSLAPQEKTLLVNMVRTSCDMAAQLYTDIKLTLDIFDMLVDWMLALSTKFSRVGGLWIPFDGLLNVPDDDMIH